MSVARNNSRIRRARESSTSLRSSVFDVAREIGLADPKASRWIYDDEVLEESHQEPIIEEEEGEEEEYVPLAHHSMSTQESASSFERTSTSDSRHSPIVQQPSHIFQTAQRTRVVIPGASTPGKLQEKHKKLHSPLNGVAGNLTSTWDDATSEEDLDRAPNVLTRKDKDSKKKKPQKHSKKEAKLLAEMEREKERAVTPVAYNPQPSWRPASGSTDDDVPINDRPVAPHSQPRKKKTILGAFGFRSRAEHNHAPSSHTPVPSIPTGADSIPTTPSTASSHSIISGTSLEFVLPIPEALPPIAHMFMQKKLEADSLAAEEETLLPYRIEPAAKPPPSPSASFARFASLPEDGITRPRPGLIASHSLSSTTSSTSLAPPVKLQTSRSANAILSNYGRRPSTADAQMESSGSSRMLAIVSPLRIQKRGPSPNPTSAPRPFTVPAPTSPLSPPRTASLSFDSFEEKSEGQDASNWDRKARRRGMATHQPALDIPPSPVPGASFETSAPRPSYDDMLTPSPESAHSSQSDQSSVDLGHNRPVSPVVSSARGRVNPFPSTPVVRKSSVAIRREQVMQRALAAETASDNRAGIGRFGVEAGLSMPGSVTRKASDPILKRGMTSRRTGAVVRFVSELAEGVNLEGSVGMVIAASAPPPAAPLPPLPTALPAVPPPATRAGLVLEIPGASNAYRSPSSADRSRATSPLPRTPRDTANRASARSVSPRPPPPRIPLPSVPSASESPISPLSAPPLTPKPMRPTRPIPSPPSASTSSPVLDDAPYPGSDSEYEHAPSPEPRPISLPTPGPSADDLARDGITAMDRTPLLMLYPGWANDTDSIMMDPKKRMSRASTWSLNTLDSVDSYYAGAGEDKDVDMQGRLADAIWKLSTN